MALVYLSYDELIVELEVRGLIGPSTFPEITRALKISLQERMDGERGLLIPHYQHEAARRRPLQELATCQEKMRAVQRYLLQSISDGVESYKMFLWVNTKLIHIKGRMDRALWVNTFSKTAHNKLDIIYYFLWDMTMNLQGGLVPRYEVADQLSRFTIRIDYAEVEAEAVVCEELAAKGQSEREFAICQSDLQAVQRWLLAGLQNGISINQMDPQLKDLLSNLCKRIGHRCACPIFQDQATYLLVPLDIIWAMVGSLRAGVISPGEAIRKLSHEIIHEPWSKNEVSQEVPEESEQANNNKDQEECKVEVVPDESEPNSEEVPEPEVVCEEDEAEVECRKLDEKQAGPDEDQCFSANDLTEAVKSDQDSGEVDVVQFEKDEVVEEPGEAPLENQPEAAVSNKEEEAIVVNEAVTKEDKGKTADEALAVPPGGAVYPDKGCITVSMRSHTKSASSPNSKARDSRKRGRRNGSATVRSKRTRCAHIVVKLCARMERHAAYVQKPVDRLLGVLDLRLEDEVLARANRRIFR